MQYGAVLLAAGKGTRFKGVKQDLEFHGKPIWRYPYELLQQLVDPDHLVVVGKDLMGGETRSQSVSIGLHALPPDTQRVAIVESARPMVTKEQLQQLLEDPCPSTSFVTALVDTVVFRTGGFLSRDDLYDLLTPQAFDYQLLLTALENGDFDLYTDETRVMFEYHHIKPHFLETGSNLYKVTYPEDIAVLESIYLQTRRGSV